MVGLATIVTRAHGGFDALVAFQHKTFYTLAAGLAVGLVAGGALFIQAFTGLGAVGYALAVHGVVWAQRLDVCWNFLNCQRRTSPLSFRAYANNSNSNNNNNIKKNSW